jgi:8-oxo-dGTP diphosphatase
VTERYQAVPRTLSFLRHGERWLLIRRAPHKRLWPNLYNGLGGHVEAGEGILESARREVREEAGVEAEDLRLVGIMHADEDGLGVIVFIFAGVTATATVRGSDEGTPVWATAEEVLRLDVLPDVRLILPRILQMQPCDPPFFARSVLDKGGMPVMTFEE